MNKIICTINNIELNVPVDALKTHPDGYSIYGTRNTDRDLSQIIETLNSNHTEYILEYTKSKIAVRINKDYIEINDVHIDKSLELEIKAIGQSIKDHAEAVANIIDGIDTVDKIVSKINSNAPYLAAYKRALLAHQKSLNSSIQLLNQQISEYTQNYQDCVIHLINKIALCITLNTLNNAYY